MKIGFDAKRAYKNFTGLGNYSRFILKSLSQNFPKNDYLLYTPVNSKQKAEITLACNNQNQTTITPKDFWKLPLMSSIWRSIYQGVSHNDRQLDIFHGLSNEIPVIKNRGTKYVVTIHDLLFCRYPELFNPIDVKIYKSKMARSCQDADQVIAISHQTKRDLIDYFGIDPEKIKVVYQGVNEIFKQEVTFEQMAFAQKKYNLPNEFLLFVSTIEKRKNVQLIIKAIKERKNWNMPLVVIGRSTAYMKDLYALIDETKLQGKIIFLHDVSYEELPAIYKLAHVFIYPSYFEGFGIPIIEAQQMGIPVITSTGSAFQEAGGDGALYNDPDDINGLVDKIEMLSDHNHRNQIIEKGYLNVKRFDQKIISDQIMGIYREVLAPSYTGKPVFAS